MAAPTATRTRLQREGDKTIEVFDVVVTRGQNAPFTITPQTMFAAQEAIGPMSGFLVLASDGKTVLLKDYPTPALTTAPVVDASGVTGLADMTSGGTYSGGVDAIFTIFISTAAGTDKFTWKKDTYSTAGVLTAGTNSVEVSVSGSAQTLNTGVTITFAATTGHTPGDTWLVFVSGTTLKFAVKIIGYGG